MIPCELILCWNCLQPLQKFRTKSNLRITFWKKSTKVRWNLFKIWAKTTEIQGQRLFSQVTENHSTDSRVFISFCSFLKIEWKSHNFNLTSQLRLWVVSERKFRISPSNSPWVYIRAMVCRSCTHWALESSFILHSCCLSISDGWSP